MRDAFSAFQSEVFRPIVTLVIPGALASSSWFVELIWQFPRLRALTSTNKDETIIILSLAVLGAGLICEDIGGRIETIFDRLENTRTNGAFDAHWNEYLRTAFVADPIGRRYARSLVMRLKFELGASVALGITALGLLRILFLPVNCSTVIVVFVLSLAIAGYLFAEAKATHRGLAQTRAVLASDLRVVSSK